MKIAGFQKRLLGWIVDFCIPFIASIPFLICFLMIQGGEVFWKIIVFFLMHYIVYIILTAPFIYILKGKTVGQVMANIKVVSQTSDELKNNQIWLKVLLSGIPPLNLLNAIYMLTTHTERSIYDRLTDTIVIDLKKEN